MTQPAAEDNLVKFDTTVPTRIADFEFKNLPIKFHVVEF